MSISKNNKGFSLVEIMVVVGVFSASITAIYSLIWKNIYVQKHNKDFLVASMLAQEGLEMTRKMRDENWRDDSTTPTGYAWEDITGNFTIDYRIGSWNSSAHVSGDNDITDEADCRLYLNGGYYDHVNSGLATKFYRLIEADDNTGDANNPHIEYTARVQWIENGARKEYAASTLLYDWK